MTFEEFEAMLRAKMNALADSYAKVYEDALMNGGGDPLEKMLAAMQADVEAMRRPRV